jgi:hypothetical protein
MKERVIMEVFKTNIRERYREFGSGVRRILAEFYTSIRIFVTHSYCLEEEILHFTHFILNL